MNKTWDSYLPCIAMAHSPQVWLFHIYWISIHAINMKIKVWQTRGSRHMLSPINIHNKKSV